MLFICMSDVIKSGEYNQVSMIADMDLFKTYDMLTSLEYIDLTKLMIEFPPIVVE